MYHQMLSKSDQIWPDKMAGLIWIQTDHKDYHQTTVNRPTL